jgi:hypothetical protein
MAKAKRKTARSATARKAAGGSRNVNVTIDASKLGKPIRLERYGLGQGGLSDDDMLAPHVPALRWLKPQVIRLFVQEYYDVYPEHGKYHWATLDRAIASIIAAGAKPLLSLCMKPTPLYPEVNQDRVHPTSYDEWERLIEAMVRHYNEELKLDIEYWEVFNEPDIGESGGCPGRFTPEAYCTYYEHTVRAIRRAWPRAKVGGPALAYYESPLLPALLDHCDRKGVPIDFVSWHYYTDDARDIRRSFDHVKSLLAKHPSLRCETIFDEWNISLGWERTGHKYQPCFIVEATYQMLEMGMDRSCYYHIRDYHVDGAKFGRFMSKGGNQFMTYWWNVMPQFHGLFDYQGHMRPSYHVFKILSHIRGARLPVETGHPHVKGLAAYDEEFDVIHILLWNYDLGKCAPRRVKLDLSNLDGRLWRYYRRRFDAETASADENDRLHLESILKVEDKRAVSESFPLEPYGMAFIAVKRFE